MNASSDFSLPPGFRAAGIHAGIKPQALDLGILIADRAGPAAALFTQNSVLGAHIGVCREHLERSGGLVRAVIVNSGNANCATGQPGVEDAIAVARAVAGTIDCPIEQVLPISTGVIGARLPLAKIVDAVPRLCNAAAAKGGEDFARAIMTTDTHPKHGAATLGEACVRGFAKGSGMIHPDMATMLGFLLTDAAVPAVLPLAGLRGVAKQIADRSFHRVSVDGDTSPNDTVLLWSSDEAPAVPEESLRAACTQVGRDLSRMIAGDGEGATRLVTIRVGGTPDEQTAATVGRAIATSMLTKTAIAGRDPNWGRILSAAGRTVTFDPDEARVSIGGVDVFSAGQPHPEREVDAAAHLRDERETRIDIDLGIGDAAAEVWTCDLTQDYVMINADYRT